jgi:hypothetical protein
MHCQLFVKNYDIFFLNTIFVLGIIFLFPDFCNTANWTNFTFGHWVIITNMFY